MKSFMNISFLAFALVIMVALSCFTYADNVEIKLGSGDGFKVQDSSGSPLMDILSNGKVGIGVLIPSEKLEVSGNIKATKFIGDGSGLTGISTGAWTTSGSDVYYNSGNVGIGTASPGSKLSLANTSSDAGKITFLNEANSVVGQIDSNLVSSSWQLELGTDGTYPQTMVIRLGNVGIGTTSPERPLHAHTASDTMIKTSTTNYSTIFGQVEGSWSGVTNPTIIMPNGTSHDVVITSAENQPILGIVIKAGGNVGIGTTSPNAKLQIVASSGNMINIHNDIGNGVYLPYGATSWSTQSDERLKDILGNIEDANQKLANLRTIYYKFKNDPTDTQRIGLIAQDVQEVFPEAVDIGPTEYLGVRYLDLVPVTIKAIQELDQRTKGLATTGQDNLRIGGKVGIGTTSPSEKLDVIGNIVASGSVTQGSSRDFKKDIDSISTKDAMEALSKLNPVKFKYKADDSSEEHLGFIAEDVPELVASKDRKHLNAMDMTAILIKVVQEQQGMLKKQQKKIEELELKMSEL